MFQLSLTKCDNQQYEVCVSSQQRRETCILKQKRKSRVCFTERELRISEPCISDSRRKDGSQKLKSSRKLEANLFDPLLTDLRNYLTKKRSANQVAPSCCYEQLITSMLSECRCSSHVSNQSVFKRLTSTSRSVKGRHSCEGDLL